MKTDKIGLKMFFYKKHIPSIEDMECVYREEKETVRHILTEYLVFSKMKRMLWEKKVRKTRYN